MTFRTPASHLLRPRPLVAAAALSLTALLGACGSSSETEGDLVTLQPGGDESADAAEPATPEPSAATEGEDAAPTPVENTAPASSPTSAQPTTPPEPVRELGPNDLPDVTVIDVNTGQDVQLASFAPAEKPIVLWFWAPH